jgi:DUF4097 and DUF4098 domain-containing protein YvlB
MTSSRINTAAIIMAAAAAAAVVTAVAGCGQLGYQRLDFNHTEDADISAIVVEPGAGDVEVRTHARSTVQIERQVRYRGSQEPTATYRIADGTLVISTDCGRRCSVSYDITAPEGVAVRGRNGSGNISLTNVGSVDVAVGSGSITVTGADSVRAETGSGNITISDARGKVAAHTGSGSIEGRRLAARDVSAETGSGNVDLRLETAGSVHARASSGSLTLTVPTGPYQVKSQTGSGHQEVAVTHEPAARYVLDVSTGSGDITVTQR